MADISNLVYPYLVTQQPRNPFSYEKIVEVNRDVATPWLDIDLIHNQLNLYGDISQDAYLEQLELAVRMYTEQYLGIALVTRTFTTYYSSGQGLYSNPAFFDLPYDNQTTVTIGSFQYWNDNFPSVLTTISPTTYQYDVSASRIIFTALPSDVSRLVANPFQATWSIAESPLAMYPDIQQAGLLLLTHLYNNRSNTVPNKLEMIPMGYQALLQPYKPLVL